MKRFISQAVVLVALAAGIAGCTGGGSESAKESREIQPGSQSAANDRAFRIQLDQTTFALKHWKTDGSHRINVSGKFTQGGEPVSGAVLHVGGSKRDIPTGDDGSFQILFDQSLLGLTDVRVVSLDKAKVGGKPIVPEQIEKGKAAAAAINVYYPIEIAKVSVSGSNPEMMEVEGRLLADQQASVAYFQEDKFRIAGIVKDGDGKRLKNAVVWIDREDGEGFAKSTPADENGYYEMFYLPEDDEDTNLSVTVGTVKYTLPKGKVYKFPDDTSLSIDITLPKEGTIIDDQPPTLVSRTAKGAMYDGLMVGLDVPEGVAYEVTIPNAEGHFKIIVPKSAWEQHPTFFETKMSQYVEDELEPGDAVPSSFIVVSADAPRGIEAAQNN